MLVSPRLHGLDVPAEHYDPLKSSTAHEECSLATWETQQGAKHAKGFPSHRPFTPSGNPLAQNALRALSPPPTSIVCIAAGNAVRGTKLVQSALPGALAALQQLRR